MINSFRLPNWKVQYFEKVLANIIQRVWLIGLKDDMTNTIHNYQSKLIRNMKCYSITYTEASASSIIMTFLRAEVAVKFKITLQPMSICPKSTEVLHHLIHINIRIQHHFQHNIFWFAWLKISISAMVFQVCLNESG